MTPTDEKLAGLVLRQAIERFGTPDLVTHFDHETGVATISPRLNCVTIEEFVRDWPVRFVSSEEAGDER